MTSRTGIVLLAALTAAFAANVQAQPPGGSNMPPDDNLCATCHGEADLWEGEKLRLFIAKESLADDVHFKAGGNCHDCHGGDPESFDGPEAHSVEVVEGQSDVRPFLFPLDKVWDSCAKCQRFDYYQEAIQACVSPEFVS